MNSKKRKVLR